MFAVIISSYWWWWCIWDDLHGGPQQHCGADKLFSFLLFQQMKWFKRDHQHLHGTGQQCYKQFRQFWTSFNCQFCLDKGRDGLCCVRPVSVRNAWWKKSAPAHSIPQYTISNTTFNWNKWLWCVQNAKETFLVQTLLALFVCAKYELSLSVCLWKIVQYRKLKNETHDQKMLFFH